MIDEFDIKFEDLDSSYVNKSVIKNNPNISRPPLAKIDNHYIRVTTDVILDKNEFLLPLEYKEIISSDTKIVWFMTDKKF